METELILKKLETISHLPQFGTNEYRKCLEQNEFLRFILETGSGEIPLCCSFKANFIYSVFIPSNKLISGYVEDLLNWQILPGDSWGFGYRLNKRNKPKPFIDKPFSSNHSKILEKAQPVTYLRYFEGKGEKKGYVEVSQFLTHLHDLHFMEERQAYCKLNKDGDIEDVIKIIYPQVGGYLTTINLDVLDFHLFLNSAVLVRFFDRVVYDKEVGFDQSHQEKSYFSDETNEIYARKGILYNQNSIATSSWIRGFQIIRNKQPNKIMLARLTGRDLEPKKYESLSLGIGNIRELSTYHAIPLNMIVILLIQVSRFKLPQPFSSRMFY